MDYLVQLAASPTAWVALATLIVMEIVLGIDKPDLHLDPHQ
jgi:predicted tellurium resistance membrane protein TerC